MGTFQSGKKSHSVLNWVNEMNEKPIAFPKITTLSKRTLQVGRLVSSDDP